MKKLEPKAVDLDLPSGTLWATFNIGATAPEEYGDYFAWGEIVSKEMYSKDTAVHKSFGPINIPIPVCGKCIMLEEYDVAIQKWGRVNNQPHSTWQTPTINDWQELIDNCTWRWAKLKGVDGCLVTGNNHRRIFLPAAGFRRDAHLITPGLSGSYWSQSPGACGRGWIGGWCVDITRYEGVHPRVSGGFLGCSVRPIIKK